MKTFTMTIFATFGEVVRVAGEVERVLATQPHRYHDQRQQHPWWYQPDLGAQQRHQIDALIMMRSMDGQVQDGRHPSCQTFGHSHGGVCRANTDVCFSYGQPEHLAATCSMAQCQQLVLLAIAQRITLPLPHRNSSEAIRAKVRDRGAVVNSLQDSK